MTPERSPSGSRRLTCRVVSSEAPKLVSCHGRAKPAYAEGSHWSAGATGRCGEGGRSLPSAAPASLAVE